MRVARVIRHTGIGRNVFIFYLPVYDDHVLYAPQRYITAFNRFSAASYFTPSTAWPVRGTRAAETNDASSITTSVRQTRIPGRLV